MATLNDQTAHAIQTLRQFESKGLLQPRYTQFHNGSSINARKLNSIVLTNRQGREMFESASSADYLTRPIALYYGISAWSRAMTMSLSLTTTEDSLSSSHGLSIVSWPRSISSASDLLDLKIKVTGGSFLEWCSTGQEFVLRAGSSKPSLKIQYDSPAAETVFTLGDLLGLIPETWDELKEITQENYLRLMYQSSGSDLQRNIWAVDGRASQPEVEACFPGLESSRVTHLNNINWRIEGRSTDDAPQFLQNNEGSFGIGDALIAPPLGDTRLSPHAIYYMTAYTFSMLARYRPSIWGSVWNLGNIDSAYPTLERAMDVIQAWFPCMLAENLTEKLS